jgi:hypothetical protein
LKALLLQAVHQAASVEAAEAQVDCYTQHQLQLQQEFLIL